MWRSECLTSSTARSATTLSESDGRSAHRSSIYSAHLMRDWRVLYVIDEERRRVTVRDVRHRRDAYRSS